jgi:long-chain acyl-CoA synthetase
VLLQENPDIENACVVGMGIPQPIALIVLSEIGKSKEKGGVITSITNSLRRINPTLNSYEQIEKTIIMRNDWTVENGLMTPSLKIKRNEVEKLHLPNYPTWYEKPGDVIWE